MEIKRLNIAIYLLHPFCFASIASYHHLMYIGGCWLSKTTLSTSLNCLKDEFFTELGNTSPFQLTNKKILLENL